jgi:protein-disulfide isomerase
MTTRRAIQEKRRKDRQKQQRNAIFALGGAAILMAAFLVFLNLRPLTGIVEITPQSVPLADGLAMGNPDAPVVLEEYGDFQCPHCLTWSQDVKPLLVDNYVETGQVYFIYRNYPILGPESFSAASASFCAAEQDRFWDYHDMLFANQSGNNSGGFSNRRLIAFADSVGLDSDSFRDCLEDDRYRADVDNDYRSAQTSGVRGTPGIVLNGQLLPDSSFDFLSRQIDAALAGTGGQ